ncbi:Non-reducing polyketide synthase PKS1 [Fulvia fulva]|nr:Non-reducing polyketide synthase PKS1 [Fulvia fulva]
MSTTTTTYTYLSASCQQVLESRLDSIPGTKVVVRSCMGDPRLSPTIIDHKCNGTVLTPSGLYADMAVEVGKHVWRHHRGQTAGLPGFNVCDLEVHKPTIVKDPTKIDEHWLEVETTASIPAGTRGDILDAVLKCAFYSITADGKRTQENGHCSVRFEWYYGWLSEWSNEAATINNRINTLHERGNKGGDSNIQIINKSRTYKLFQSFVDYTGKYQNMSEVVYDSATLEATSLLTFLADPATDCTGPYYLDGSCHISGFVANAVEKDKDKNAFISNGVSAMKLSPRFDPAKKGSVTRNYVQMKQLETDKTVLEGDVYILQDGEIVGVWESVRFKKIPRKVLNVFLPPPKK